MVFIFHVASPMAREIWVQSQVESYQRLKKWYLMPPCLTLSIIRYGSRVKWSNPGKGVAPSPTPRRSKLSKREPSGHPRLWSPTLLFFYLTWGCTFFYPGLRPANMCIFLCWSTSFPGKAGRVFLRIHKGLPVACAPLSSTAKGLSWQGWFKMRSASQRPK